MKRRDFLQATAATCAVALANPASALPAAFELDELTISDLQQGLQSGKYTARELVEKYSERISDIDKKGPALRSVIEMNPDAEKIAADLDRERKERGSRGPLHGIPILIKDNIDTHDRMMTTAGSLALVGAKPARDAFVAQRLREAGAVILGKTNLSEWANFRSTKSSSGWSARGGQTKNPYALDRNPCGSSSGSGAAVAANLCAAAIGTETDGSIVCPSSANSLVGIKPTLGLIPGTGIIPIAHSQDTAGPMTRTVRDGAILLGVLANSREDYTKYLDNDGLRSMRIGIARKNFGFNDRVDKLMNGLLDEMKKLGAVLVDPADIPTSGKFDDSEFEVLLYEFKADLNAYLAGLGPQAPVRSLKDVIEFNEKNRDREMPYFGQDIMIRAEAKGPLTSKAYIQALRKNHLLTRTQGIDFVMKKHRLDAMVAPTGGPPWPTDWINGDHFSGGYSSASAVAGYPHITVPAGYVFGLPVGISFFAGANTEPKLLKIAYAFEQATRIRRPPKFSPNADF
ncbi:MAG TPA: amidase [Pyrinomonadaceae bacterium]